MGALRFREHFHFELADEELVFLVTESTSHVLQGRLYQRIAPLVDGTRTAEQIAAALADHATPFEVMYALDRLRQRGFTTDVPPARGEADAAFWCGLGIEPARAEAAASSAAIGVRGIGADASPFAARLAALGFDVRDADGDVRLVVTDDYGRDELAGINREAHDRRRPWMLVKPIGVVVWLGPIFEPGVTPCWECLRPRLLENQQAERYASDRSQTAERIVTSIAALTSTVSLAAALAATELARYVAHRQSSPDHGAPAPPKTSRLHDGLAGRIATFDTLSHQTAWHTVIRRPHCVVCGSPQPAGRDVAIHLTARPKRDTSGGGHRVLTPQQAHDRLQHLVSPITGIVTWMTPKEVDPSGAIHTFSIGHPFPTISNEVAVLRANLRYRAGGKGLTETHARVSAICEAIERYSCVWRGDEPVRRTTARALGDEVVPLDDILQFSPSQYAGRVEWNRTCSVPFFHMVPHPFDPDAEMDWTPVWSLTRARRAYVPAALCSYAHPDLRASFFCWADSNGTASGATREEAIVQATFELVERDAIALWWYNRVRRAGIDIDSFALPEWPAIRREYARRHREIWAIDLTTDLGIPTYAAVSRRMDDRPEDLMVGFGAHFDAAVALTRAITEANELLPALSRTGPDRRRIYLSDDKEAIAWWRECTIASEPYVTPDPSQPLRRREQYASLATADLREDVQVLVDLLDRHGLELFVLDQTHPDLAFPVVRVIVPGLRHFWRRLGPGRLYDVPVRMGWLPRAREEHEMNPRSVFL